MDEINIQERLNERFGELPASGNAAFDQKGVELAAFAQDGFSSIRRIILRLQTSGKAIKVWTEWAAPEVHEGAFFFIPVFEHKNS